MNQVNVKIAGILYILGTISGIFSYLVFNIVENLSIFQHSFFQENVSLFSSIFIWLKGIILALIPIFLLRILTLINKYLAYTYVFFRSFLEFLIYIIIGLGKLNLDTIKDFPFIKIINTINESGKTESISIIIFICGSCIFYYLLYKQKLIPNWLSIWGILSLFPYFFLG